MKTIGITQSSARNFEICRVWGSGSFAHICFESIGCRFRHAGHCIMCDYGSGNNVTTAQAVSALQQLLSTWPEPLERLLLGTCGSILDPSEMPINVFEALLHTLSSSNPRSILFETHYTTVTTDILTTIKKVLPNKHISIEMGLESCNKTVLNSLHKNLNLSDFQKTIQLVREFGMSPVLNVFLGAPFLVPEEQIEDSKNSIDWALDHGAEQVVIFPANIKPNTELWNLYKSGLYNPPSHWLLIDLLQRLDKESLSKISLSWYGDRQEAGYDTDILPPDSCEICHSSLLSFYNRFMHSFDPIVRKELLNLLIQEKSCSCYSRIHL